MEWWRFIENLQFSTTYVELFQISTTSTRCSSTASLLTQRAKLDRYNWLMEKRIILTFFFLILFAGTHDVHAQKGTFALAETFTSAEIPRNTKVYLVPGKKNVVVVYGIDIDTLEIKVIDKVLLITSSKKILKGHILIYYDSKKSLDYPTERAPTLQKIIKV